MTLPDGLLLGFYGDDFTGSTDGMEALAKAGIRTALFLQPPRPEQLEAFPGLRAVGVAGVSRSLSPVEMEAELPPVFAGLRSLAPPLVHVKICSTFDSSPEIGSIGRTIELGREAFPGAFVPLLVGAPILNRFQVFGNLFARSGPESDVFRLDRHPTMRRHPVTPMDESDLRLHLAGQTTLPIGLVNVLQIEAGTKAVEAQVKSLTEAGCAVILFDVLADTHLETIGEFFWNVALAQRPLFVVGSSGVEYALTAYWRSRGWLPALPTFAVPPVEQIIVVSGSCSPVTARQIQRATENGFAEFALPAGCWLQELEQEAAASLARKAMGVALQQGRSIVVHACQGPDDPRIATTRARLETVEAADRRRGSEQLGTLLGCLLRDVLRESGVRRAIVAGGDTSGYVARALGIEALEMIAPFAPGSPLCRATLPGDALDGVELLFKGGQVGRVDLFGSVLRGTS